MVGQGNGVYIFSALSSGALNLIARLVRLGYYDGVQDVGRGRLLGLI